MKKRGISAVVATVLIILITIAAVAIIWISIVPMIRENTFLREKQVDLTIETAGGYTIWDDDSKNVTIQVSRGSDQEIMTGIKIVVNTEGNSQTFTFSEIPEPNQARLYEINLSAKPDSISVFPIFEGGDVGIISSTTNSIPEGDASNVEGIAPFNEPPVEPTWSSCGNNVCDDNEYFLSCFEDCGQGYGKNITSDFDDWTTYDETYAVSSSSNEEGRIFLASPVIDVGNNNEQIHHWITVDYTATSGGKVRLILGHSNSNDLNNVMTTYYRTNFENLVDSGENTHIASQYKKEQYSWVILEVDDNVTLNSVSHTYWIGYNTAYGHEAREFEFAGSSLPYRILYPNNYDPDKSYPLIFSTAGSGGIGDDNIKQMEIVQYGRYMFEKYYFTEEFEAFSVVAQVPKMDSNIPLPYYPTGTSGGRDPDYHPDYMHVNADGFYAEAVVALANAMIEYPDMNIDENRIYYTGFSLGGKGAYEMAKEDPDLWAAIWSVAGWPIKRYGDAYFERPELLSCAEIKAQEPFAPCLDFTPYPAIGAPVRIKLQEEVEIYKNIPFRVGSGKLDGASYGGAFACEIINEAGGTCIHDLFKNTNHLGSAGKAYGNIEYVRWLFDQIKS